MSTRPRGLTASPSPPFHCLTFPIPPRRYVSHLLRDGPCLKMDPVRFRGGPEQLREDLLHILKLRLEFLRVAY